MVIEHIQSATSNQYRVLTGKTRVVEVEKTGGATIRLLKPIWLELGRRITKLRFFLLNGRLF